MNIMIFFALVLLSELCDWKLFQKEGAKMHALILRGRLLLQGMALGCCVKGETHH